MINLSDRIKLTEIPDHYYHPRDEFEQAILCRHEYIPTHIYPSIDQAATAVATKIATEIASAQAAGRDYILGISGGTSPSPILQELVRLYQEGAVSFACVYVVVAYEYYPLSPNGIGCLARLTEDFLDPVGIQPQRIISPDVSVGREHILDVVTTFDRRISDLGGIDLLLMGIGTNGNLCFNMPGSQPNSRTRLVVLDHMAHNDSLSLFNSHDEIPSSGISIGLSTIAAARRVLVLAWGEAKADAIQTAVEGRVSDAIPASHLQLHNAAEIYVDQTAASLLTRISHPWLVGPAQWNDQLIRRAIVWLCKLVDKPILKLTNKDYTDHGLGELLALYGSAYKVNIKIFNDIQHTITGWPGGKPQADDSERPERATPYPKRVIVFSPHPDDDVISMGGTLARLVQQGHDVHVAYQTSGNIAVGDEDLRRYVGFASEISKQDRNNATKSSLEDEMIQVLHMMDKKPDGGVEPLPIRMMKGAIRREEARSACRYVGIRADNIHFLDLPFYETGAVKKNPPTKSDVRIIHHLIAEIRPHQIFLAGDLADPHGTHKVCLDIAMEAIEEEKEKDWMKDCYIWMYRGAWAEWEIDHIEMAVPMSPEELRSKRNSILCHQSQMESAPFLGDDTRLFWQRAEDRNRATARLYASLGLASYEAIEAFVRYRPDKLLPTDTQNDTDKARI